MLEGYFSPLKEGLFRHIERLLACISTRLITLRPSLRKELVGLGVASEEKISVVPLGIELDSFLERYGKIAGSGQLRRELGVSADVPLVGIVGRLVPIKDYENFLQVASLLVRGECGEREASAHFVIMGGGGLLRGLEARAHELGIAGRSHFTGWRSDLPEIYKSLYLVALTSLNEGPPPFFDRGDGGGEPGGGNAGGGRSGSGRRIRGCRVGERNFRG